MCGIAGVVRPIPGGGTTTRPPREELTALARRMTDAVTHRGPDGSGLWHAPGQEVVFGHRRLAILDLSDAGAQPMIDEATGCAITFNGEIYNFHEIRRELEAAGFTFRSACDTEVILKAYAQWGIDAVKRFRGIFAFALWDPRVRSVHLVRDPMGIKPLYWTAVADRGTGEELVLFASELRALLASGAVPRRLDPEGVASYLWHGFVVGPGTILENVRLLPAAGILTFSADPASPGRNGRAERRYWRMPSSAPRPTTPDELRDELRATVGMQLISDVPLGIFLSGGIDSSAVAVLASEVAPDAIHTFTIGFDVPRYDETIHAQKVADAIGSRHEKVVLTEQTFQSQLDAALASIDQPTFDAINTYFVSRATREAGMTVALAGTGGDELFGGYRTWVDVPNALRAGERLPLPAGSRRRRAFDYAVGAAAGAADALAWSLLKEAPPQTRWGKIADVVRASSDLLGLYQVSYALFTRETQAHLARPEVRAAQARLTYGLPAEVATEWRARASGTEMRHAISLLELSSFVGERLLRDSDAASMAVALELRVPLLDHVLTEAVAGVEPARRFMPLGRKQLLRDVALARLDPAIFERPKAGFVLPIDTWARRRLQPQMQDVFADEALAGRVGLDGGAVLTLWRSFCAGRPGLYWSRAWALFVLLSWCRTHDARLAA